MCEGYEVATAMGRGVQIRAASPLCVAPQSSIGSLLNLTGEEVSSFNFFQQKTSREVQGCFQSDLWECLVLQISHQEPSILHAVISIGSTHKRLLEASQLTDNEQDQVQCRQFSLRQYVTAISFLRSRIENLEDPRSNEVALVTCMLFICLELMQGQRLAALSHLGTGLRILSSSSQQMQNEGTVIRPKYDSQVLLDQLTGVFTRLDLESTMFGVKSPHFLLLPASSKSRENVIVPSSFTSLAMARHYLDILANGVFRFRGALLQVAADLIPDTGLDVATRLCWEHATTRKVDLSDHPTLLIELRGLQNGLAVWAAAFEAFKEQIPESSRDKDFKTRTLLEIQHFYPYFLISTCQTTKERYCDSFDDLFKRIVSLASVYLLGPTIGKSTEQSTPRPIFTLESGVIPSLYLAAMKCRCPQTRREAISLLYNMSCQEGMWEASLIAQFVERIADLEESRVDLGNPLLEASDVSEKARFCDVLLVESEDPACGKLICARYCHEKGGELVVWEELFPLRR
jgi:hypothetical protein